MELDEMFKKKTNTKLYFEDDGLISQKKMLKTLAHIASKNGCKEKELKQVSNAFQLTSYENLRISLELTVGILCNLERLVSKTNIKELMHIQILAEELKDHLYCAIEYFPENLESV